MRTLLVLFCFSLVCSCQKELDPPAAPITPREWVAASARYHDPQALWPVFQAEVKVSTKLPDGRDAYANDLYFDRVIDTFSRKIVDDDGFTLVQTVAPDGACAATWDKPDATENQRRNNGLLDNPCSYIAFRKKFYDFLLGLPMVALEGESSFRQNTARVLAFGVETVEVEARFSEDPSEPTWYLYFEPDTYRLHAAKFLFADGRGEWLHYKEDVNFGPFRIKANQYWSTAPGLTPIIIDTLIYKAWLR